MISVLMPSRRKERLWEACKSLTRTAKGEVEVIVGQNPDCLFDLPEGVIRHVSPTGPSQRTHEMAAMCKGDILLTGGDDFLWRTEGWDELFLEKAKEKPIACFYFNDGHSPMDSRIPAVTRKFYEIAGFFPPHFFHFYGDTWVAKIAEGAGCFYPALDIVIEHMHPKFGKAERDAVYGMRGSADKKKWDETAPERARLIEKLRAELERFSKGSGVTESTGAA